jgi:hypothetical protein
MDSATLIQITAGAQFIGILIVPIQLRRTRVR